MRTQLTLKNGTVTITNNQPASLAILPRKVKSEMVSSYFYKTDYNVSYQQTKSTEF